MSFFQNPFTTEFRGSLVLGDRQYSQNFICPANWGRGDEQIVAWKAGPYNLSGNDASGNATRYLDLMYSIDAMNFKNWTLMRVDLSTGAALTVYDIVAALNLDATFSSWLTASVNQGGQIQIRQNFPVGRFKFYVVNGRAEEVLGFNAKAGVVELPTYFRRHCVDKLATFADCANLLVYLDTANPSSALVITTAVDSKGQPLGYTASASADYVLMHGRSGIFNFQKITVDVSDRITQIIEYPAGAVAGDLARKINYSYTSTNTKPDKVTEVPYTLTSGDLVTP